MTKRKNFLFILLVLAMLLCACGKKEVSVENSSSEVEKKEQVQLEKMEVTSIEFPYFLDNGNLEIGSLFQFDGMNPDCNNSEGVEVAAIELINHSTEYLKEVKISMILEDETKLNFNITEVPAGREIMAFSTDNTVISQDARCIDVRCETIYETESLDNEEKIAVSIDGINVTLTNLTEEEITECSVYCHNVLGELFFGGTSYRYVVNRLPENGSVMIEATDCVLGMLDVVRWEMN